MKPLRIIIVEDQPDDATIILFELKRGGFDPIYTRVDTESALREALSTEEWDIVTSDHSMPMFSAPEALEIVQSIKPDLPVVIVSGEIDITLAVSLMKAGAKDYVQKKDVARLPLIIERELREVEAVYKRQGMEEALRTSEQTIQARESDYRAIFENSIDAIAVFMDGVHVSVNPAYVKMFGYDKPEDLIGRSIFYLVAPDDHERLMAYHAARRQGQPAPQEYVARGIKRDGSELDLEVRVSSYEVKNQLQMVGILHDITKRKMMEQKLRQSEERLNSLYKNMAEGVALHELVFDECEQPVNYRIMDINPQFERILGLRYENVIDKMATEAYGTPEPPYLKEYSMVALTGNPGKLETYFTPLDKYFLISIAPWGKYGFATIFSDITERKLSEQAMRESEEKFHRLYMDAPLGIFHSNFSGQFYDVNPALAELLGYDSPQDVLDSIYNIAEQIYAEPPKRDAVIEKTLNEGNLVTHVNKYRRKNGEEWDAYLRLRVVMDNEGHHLYLQGFVEDITKRTRQEAEIRRLNQNLERLVEQRTAELQSFVHSVSHDLRAPLRTVKEFSRILLEDYSDKLDDNGRHFINKIIEAANHQNDLMDALLLLARVGSAELQYDDVDLIKFVKNIASSLGAAEPSRQVEFILEESLTVKGDPRLMQIVIENLISNAWKYTALKGQALIEVGAVSLHGEKVYYVRDNGVGFDMKYASQVFDVFKRLHSNDEFAGNGVGLSIVRRIIDRHGGSIWAEGEVGKGATFYFSLGSS
ncbi:MAG: PAS domain S-box protein [Acidobacteriota bacterium]